MKFFLILLTFLNFYAFVNAQQERLDLMRKKVITQKPDTADFTAFYDVFRELANASNPLSIYAAKLFQKQAQLTKYEPHQHIAVYALGLSYMYSYPSNYDSSMYYFKTVLPILTNI